MINFYIAASLLAATAVVAQEPQPKSFIVRVTHPSRSTIAETVIKTGSMESPAVVEILSKISGRLIATSLADGTEVTEGTLVHKGDVIAKIDARDYAAKLAIAEAILDATQATFEEAQKEASRTTALLKDNTATEQESDQAQAVLLRAKASVKEAEANLALAKLNMEETEIRSPLDGKVAVKHVYPGAMLSLNTTIYTITEMNLLKLFFDLPTTLFSKIQAGITDVAVTVDAYPEETLDLKIYSVHPVASDSTRTVKVELHVDNADGKYLPGMYAKGEVALNKRENVLVISRDCLIVALDKALVYKVVDGHAVTTEIKLGTRFNDVLEVVDGLTDGDVVISMGQHRLTDGAAVKIENAQ